MENFVQQVVSGLATGGIYAALALALVMIYQATTLVNFAQGEMATFSTYIAWSLIHAGLPYWVAFALTVIISLVGGVLIERLVIRPIGEANILSVVIVFIGLLVIFQSVAGWIFDYIIKPFPTPFSTEPLSVSGISFSSHDIGTIVVTLVVLALLYVFFRYLPLGLAMRAAASNAASARLVGVRVGWMLALGWGLAAAVGSIAGMIVAHKVFLEPNMMSGVLLYAFAGALLGGIANPVGAVVGGFTVGVLENLIGSYVPFVGSELKLTVALVLIIVVLVFKPSGLFGKQLVRRV